MNSPAYKSLIKKYFILTSCYCISLIGIFILVFYIIDPLQFFHKSWFQDNNLSTDMRAQAAGIINSFNIDSIILGTSMLENTSAAEASSKLGGKFFNISISGGDYAERAHILKKALQKNLKNVIYSLDMYYLGCESRNSDTWKYLYDTSHLNDFKYYASFKNIFNLFKKRRGLEQVNMDRPMAWEENPEHSRRFGGIENWVANKEDPQIKDWLSNELPHTAKIFSAAARKEVHDAKREKAAKHYITEYLLKIISAFPDTNFYFIFPPYSRFFFANKLRNSPADFFLHQEMVRFLVKKTMKMKNVHIYGFEDQDFPDAIENYKDVTHYHQKFNSLFLDAMVSGKHELTSKNVEEYLKECEQKAWDYDIPALNDKVQRLMREDQG